MFFIGVALLASVWRTRRAIYRRFRTFRCGFWGLLGWMIRAFWGGGGGAGHTGCELWGGSLDWLDLNT